MHQKSYPSQPTTVTSHRSAAATTTKIEERTLKPGTAYAANAEESGNGLPSFSGMAMRTLTAHMLLPVYYFGAGTFFCFGLKTTATFFALNLTLHSHRALSPKGF